MEGAQNNTANFFGLTEEFSTQENSKAVIVPVSGVGVQGSEADGKDASTAILEASKQVEYFDDELWVEPYRIGIQTASPVSIQAQDDRSESSFEALAEAVRPIVEFGKFPIIIGDDHSISLGGIKACVERFSDLSVLQIGAHAGMRECYQGKTHCQATITHHMYKLLLQPCITQVGIRNISLSEVTWLEEKEPAINIFWARHQDAWNFHEIVHTLSDNVYLSIDLSALDPSIMPATKAPEPGGISWEQLTELIKLTCVRKTVVGADIVELAPIKDFHAPEFLTAKLLYKLIGYRFAMELGVTKKYL